MPDKYHKEWNYQDFAADVLIFKGQQRAFEFLGDMAYSLDGAIEMLEGIKQLPALALRLRLMKRKCHYLEMANSIGRLWGDNDDSV